MCCTEWTLGAVLYEDELATIWECGCNSTDVDPNGASPVSTAHWTLSLALLFYALQLIRPLAWCWQPIVWFVSAMNRPIQDSVMGRSEGLTPRRVQRLRSLRQHFKIRLKNICRMFSLLCSFKDSTFWTMTQQHTISACGFLLAIKQLLKISTFETPVSPGKRR